MMSDVMVILTKCLTPGSQGRPGQDVRLYQWPQPPVQLQGAQARGRRGELHRDARYTLYNAMSRLFCFFNYLNNFFENLYDINRMHPGGLG